MTVESPWSRIFRIEKKDPEMQPQAKYEVKEISYDFMYLVSFPAIKVEKNYEIPLSCVASLRDLKS